jgi:hypothetical protein
MVIGEGQPMFTMFYPHMMPSMGHLMGFPGLATEKQKKQSEPYKGISRYTWSSIFNLCPKLPLPPRNEQEHPNYVNAH